MLGSLKRSASSIVTTILGVAFNAPRHVRSNGFWVPSNAHDEVHKMTHIKKVFTITICFLIMLTSAFYAYTSIDSRCLVYADSTTDNWQNVTTNAELVEAFRYYCKSRDLTIDGSVADAVTSFTTKTFNGICNTLGIDVTALQAQLKKETDGNTGTRFLFTATGIDAYNRIFAQFLQDNNLSVGDDNVNITVESGIYFKDYDGNGCWCFVSNNVTSATSIVSNSNPSNVYSNKGTPYIYTEESVNNIYLSGQNLESQSIHLTQSISYQFVAVSKK